MKRLIPLWIACVTAATATVQDDVSRAAISFLEKARAGKIDLAVGKDTAISPDTGTDKQQEISKRIKSLRTELSDAPFAPGPVRVEADSAAAIIRQAEGYDSSLYHTHAIGVVRKDGEWIAAPVPGSFENSTVGDDATLRARQQKLEEWMIQACSLDLLSLQDGAAARLRDDVGKHIDLESMRKLDATGFINLLLSACEKADTLTLLACLGGAEPTLPDNWSERLRSATSAYNRGKATHSPWRILAASGALRCLTVEETGDNKAAATLFCLDPFAYQTNAGQSNQDIPRFESLHLDLSRNRAAGWRFDPQEDFFAPQAMDDPFIPDKHSIGKKQVSEMIHNLRKRIPETPMPGSREAIDAWLSGLRGTSFPDTIRMLALQDTPDTPLAGCTAMAYLWQRLHDPRHLRIPLLLDSHEDGASALCLIQLFSASNPSETDLHQIFFRKSPRGWLVHPAIRPPQPSNDPEIISLTNWAERITSNRSFDWSAGLTSDLPHIRDLTPARTPKPDEIRPLMETWLLSLGQGDLNASLAMSALFADERGAEKLMRALGSLMSQLRPDDVKSRILSIQANGHWAGISLRLDDPRDTKSPSYPFFAIVMTPQGPRVLPEIDLTYATNRTREYLNTATWNRLGSLLPKDAVEELHSLFGGHIKASEADRQKEPARTNAPPAKAANGK